MSKRDKGLVIDYEYWRFYYQVIESLTELYQRVGCLHKGWGKRHEQYSDEGWKYPVYTH